MGTVSGRGAAARFEQGEGQKHVSFAWMVLMLTVGWEGDTESDGETEAAEARTCGEEGRVAPQLLQVKGGAGQARPGHGEHPQALLWSRGGNTLTGGSLGKQEG